MIVPQLNVRLEGKLPPPLLPLDIIVLLTSMDGFISPAIFVVVMEQITSPPLPFAFDLGTNVPSYDKFGTIHNLNLLLLC